VAESRPTVAVYKFSSCDGCQLSLLNMEDEILDLAKAVDIAFFLEATRASRPGPYDIALVEGSITTEHEVTRIQEVRAQATTLIALGTCATAGGVQALRNFADADEFASRVYPHPEYLSFLPTSKPISDYVKTDFELWGCPINKQELLQVIVALLNKRRPSLPAYPVCMECKRRGASCVLVASGTLCLGPATQAGCGALCPGMGRGCYGCFGPSRHSNPDSLRATLLSLESRPGEAARLFRGISANAAIFRAAANELLGESR